MPFHADDRRIGGIEARVVRQRRMRIACAFDEFLVTRIRYFMYVHIKRVKGDGMYGLFVAVAGVGPHLECACGDQHHCSTVNFRNDFSGMFDG